MAIPERKILLKKRAKFLLSVTLVVVTSVAIASLAGVLILSATNPSIIVWRPDGGPVLHDDTLAVELVADGLDSPTSMRFLDERTLLVLEKNKGQVRIVLDSKVLKAPAIQVDVAAGPEQGLLGIAIWNESNETNPAVFLYLTEENQHNKPRNLVYKYLYDEDEKTLENKTLILDLPGEPGPYHNGGKMSIGPHDGYIYAVIGDVSSGGGMLDNQMPGRPPDDKSVILRVDRDTGSPAPDNPFYNKSFTGEGMEKLKRYYAYGIRNSFGMDFEPITGKLWITENGEHAYDEINIVEPGFNSGWHKVMGPIGRTNMTVQKDLVIFDGAKYQDPIFSWYAPVGVTDIEFFNSTKLGDEYNGNLFVGDINNGNLYFFKLNDNRTGLTFHDPRLLDLVADPVREEEQQERGDDEDSELSSLIFGEGFGRITDIETGPDGLLYILTYEDGKIYRITKELN
ncbi:MAG: PQQ-dependent sugar dehydrogenase [Thermoproteota archaeon]|nr:PQQ-dependent sugar dehydrogenase [Thermoproteota archaeon]